MNKEEFIDKEGKKLFSCQIHYLNKISANTNLKYVLKHSFNGLRNDWIF